MSAATVLRFDHHEHRPSVHVQRFLDHAPFLWFLVVFLPPVEL